jgi:hypothetical protein
MRRISALASLAVLLAACGVPTPQSNTSSQFYKVSPTPTQTLTALPQIPTPTPGPLTLLTPAVVVEDVTATPRPEPTPFTITLPSESLYFELPGPGSHVVGSIRVVGFGGPSAYERVNLRLLGSDGRVLVSHSTRLSVYPGNAGRFYATLTFSIPALAEDARLEASTYDPTDGQLGHMATLDLVLLSVGSPRILRGFQGAEKITLLSPLEGESIRGGVARVRGAAWLSADVPLVVQVLDSSGNVVGSLEVPLDVPEPGVLAQFDVEVPYQITNAQRGRIAVFEPGEHIPGIVHYNSVSVQLQP